MGEGPGVPGVSEAERPPGGVGSSGARAEASQPPRAQAPRQSCFLGPTCPRQQEDVAVLPRTQGTLRGQRWGRRHHTPGGRPLLGSRADSAPTDKAQEVLPQPVLPTLLRRWPSRKGDFWPSHICQEAGPRKSLYNPEPLDSPKESKARETPTLL